MGGSLARGIGLAVVLALLGAGVGWWFGVQRADSHVAEATILVDPLEGNPFFPSGSGGDLLNLETEAQLVGSDSVARLVAQRVDTSATTDELLDGLTVSLRPNTQVLDIEYAARTEEDATLRAQAFAEVFLEFRKARAEASRFDKRATIEDALGSETEQLSRLITERAKAPARSVRAALITEQITARTAYIGELRTHLAQYEGGATDPGQVVTPATAAPPTVLTSPAAMAVIGALLGASGAFVGGVMRSSVRGKVRSASDLEGLDLSVLGSVPGHELKEIDDALRNPDRPQPELGQGLKRLRIAVLTRERRRPVSILVAGVGDVQAPMPFVGQGLAAAIALADVPTALVDATWDQDGSSKALGAEAEAGLTELLFGEVSVDDALVPLARNLSFLGSGKARADIDNLVVHPGMPLLLADLKKRFDVVILLAKPVSEPAGHALTEVVDTVLVEVHRGVDRVGDLADLVNQGALGAVPLGLVYTESRRRGRRS